MQRTRTEPRRHVLLAVLCGLIFPFGGGHWYARRWLSAAVIAVQNFLAVVAQFGSESDLGLKIVLVTAPLDAIFAARAVWKSNAGIKTKDKGLAGGLIFISAVIIAFTFDMVRLGVL